MISANFHTHSTFCDGKNSPEEMVKAAIEKGFSAIGFSGHGFTEFDQRYCMKDTEGYLAEIRRLQIEYQNRIQIYLGVEEDTFSPVKRNDFEYLIGSSHYLYLDGAYYPVDSGLTRLEKCMDLFAWDAVKLAEAYYQSFCRYLKSRKPDIIGHFDLITKFDESGRAYFLDQPGYQTVAEKYLKEAAGFGLLFEVNTGAMARGLRTAPYPQEYLLYRLKELEARLILSSDCHEAKYLDAYFEETRKMLLDIGFRYVYTMVDHRFQRVCL